MSKITLAEGKVSARLHGAGAGRDVLVLFHSLLADASSFARVVPALAERFTVVLADLPGFGGSEAVPGGAMPAVAARMAVAVREAAERYSPGRAPLLLGNGYGGFVALQLALDNPGLLARLVLADSGARFSDPGREQFRGMARGAGAKGLEAVAETAMRRLFAPDFHAANPALVAERRASFLAMDMAVFLDACGVLAGLDLLPALPGLTLPVLALVGEQDEATPPPMSEALVAAAPNARLVVLQGCAHVPQLQAPERFLAEVVPFLLAA